MFRAIIFDMDGVVVNSEPAHALAENVIFGSLGITPTPEDWAHFIGRSDEGVMAHMRQKYGIRATVDELVSEKHRLYRAVHREHITLMQGFTALTQGLSGNCRLALTTSSTKEDTDFVLKRFRLHDLFKAVVTADDVARTKPDPEPYLRTAELLGLRPGQCVVIEDAVNGLVSARKAGTATIGLASTFPAEELAKHADAVAESLSEIPEILSRLPSVFEVRYK